MTDRPDAPDSKDATEAHAATEATTSPGVSAAPAACAPSATGAASEAPALPPGFADWEEPMRLALAQARLAAEADEVPVGAVLLGPDGAVLAAAANAPISSQDPTAHAEILALRAGAKALCNYRLTGCTLVVTLEPCLMCLGAMIHARVAALVYGAPDPKSGAVASRLDGANLDFVNHRFPVLGGVLADDCGDVLRQFFRARR